MDNDGCSGPCDECVNHYTGSCSIDLSDEFIQMTEDKAKRLLDMYIHRLKYGIEGVEYVVYKRECKQNDIEYIERIHEKYPNLK